MNWDEVRGNAALSLLAVLIVWLFLLRTNIKRRYRILPAGCAGLACFALFAINDKLAHAAGESRFSAWWYQNIGFVVIAMALGAVTVAGYQQGRHVKRGSSSGSSLKRSHAHVRARV